jgi:hypothetical protein
MVGWSKRNGDSKKRQHQEWLTSLTPEMLEGYHAQVALDNIEKKKDLRKMLWFFTPIGVLSLVAVPSFPLAILIVIGVATMWSMYVFDYKDVP